MTEPDSLIEPVNADSVCGAELIYDPEFVALQQAATGRIEQQFGQTIIPAELPDWHRVERQAKALLGRTKDLRIVAVLTRAWTEINGLPGYAAGVWIAAELLERYWDELHPHIDADGESDPLMRINALYALVDLHDVGGAVRAATLISGKNGRVMLRDAATLLEGGKPLTAGFSHIEPHQFRGDLEAAARNGSSTLAAVQATLDALARIERRVRASLGESWALDFANVESPLRVVLAALPNSVSEHGAQQRTVAALQPEPVDEAQREERIDRVSGGAYAGSSVRSREDVARVLKQACDYMEQQEPSHPAPLLMRRALGMLGMSFPELVREMTPAGLQQLEWWAGSLAEAPAAAGDQHR
jgi:type VI secretion system protein ImpA